MKVKIAEKNNKGTPYFINPINWLLRITALSNIYCHEEQLVEEASLTTVIVYVIIFGALNVYCLCFKIETFVGNTDTGVLKFSDTIQMIYWMSYLVYIIDMFCVYKYSRNFVLKYFSPLDRIDQMLGNPAHNEIRKTILYTIIYSVIIFLMCSIFDYISWFLLEDCITATIYAVDYLYFFLNMLTLLDAMSHIIQVEHRLKMLGDLLHHYNNEHFIKHHTEESVVKDDNKKSLRSLNMLSHRRDFETAWFSKCYIILLEQVDFFNNIFGFRVLIYCTNLLFHCISLLNLAIRIIKGTMNTKHYDTRYFLIPSVSAVARVINYAIMAILVMYRCEQTYKKNETILDTIDMLLTTHSNNAELKLGLKEFHNLLITRPIKFHAANFFTMDYTLLVSMSSVVVTYTVIMLQSMQ